ncbi:hypothetical protein [Ornithinimicrobium kibberense]|uniref:hypothetical protein n=1 Tax=Ornithinimicrobium kibberense TaxID=282060 RepID=UPI003614AFF3
MRARAVAGPAGGRAVAVIAADATPGPGSGGLGRPRACPVPWTGSPPRRRPRLWTTPVPVAPTVAGSGRWDV